MPGPRYVKDFEFPQSAGFTGSATDRSTVPVRAYERQRFAKGGKVMAKPAPGSKTDRRLSTRATVRGGARRRQERALGLFKGGMVEGNDRGLVSRNPPVAEEEQGTSPLRRGYKKGGRMKKSGLAQACSKGGRLNKKDAKRMGYAMGGPVAAKKGGEMRKVAQEVVAEHVAYPAPKGHKGLRAAKGGFQRTPMYGK